MKKVVLVVPGLTSEERYGQFHRIMGSGIIRPPLGLLSNGAVLEKAGHRVCLIDALALHLDVEEAAKRILQESPKIVGFTAYSISILSAARLARRVKELDSSVLTVVGGPHVTAVPEETMARFKAFDIGVIGEGEETVRELVEARDTEDRLRIKGLIVRDGDDLRLAEGRPLVRDLDSLPFPAWELLEGFPRRYPLKRIRYRQSPVGDLCTSRGCPYPCTFCDKAVFGSKFRAFSASYVVEAIDRLRDLFGVQEIMFKDDLIMFDRERLVEICEHLLRSNWGLTWTCMGRADCVDRELLGLMKQAGCWQVSYGIESAEQIILDSVRKSLSLEEIEEALNLTKQAGLSPRGYFILGLPHETEGSIRRTIGFAKRSPLDDINVALLTPFPGTDLYNDATRYGDLDNDWNSMNKLRAVFVPHGLTREALEGYLKRFYLEFFARPGVLARQLGLLLS